MEENCVPESNKINSIRKYRDVRKIDLENHDF